ncbi:MAG: RsmD family RNA methyltransferase [Alloprevotella sp.]|nr:RsmD family RNA methyltransferase [Bacteroidales bacterium]MDY3943082.1 RsmD family RNA methyltransferase [Alloprevotella sp.]
MRVITGKYKGRHFDVPRNFKARPTTDFAKENLFNVLRSYLDFEESTALDLFAGTGSISLELLSRGCPRVVCVERDRQHFGFLAQMFRTLGDAAIVPLCADALRFIDRAKEGFDLVFADPPYALRELGELPDRLFRSQLLKPSGLFVLEHGKDHDFSQHPHFLEHRAYGSVNFSFFGLKAQEADNTPKCAE